VAGARRGVCGPGLGQDAKLRGTLTRVAGDRAGKDANCMARLRGWLATVQVSM
jgi:hypothetical protein